MQNTGSQLKKLTTVATNVRCNWDDLWQDDMNTDEFIVVTHISKDAHFI